MNKQIYIFYKLSFTWLIKYHIGASILSEEASWVIHPFGLSAGKYAR